MIAEVKSKSQEYRIGFMRAQAAVAAHGYRNLTPSLADRLEYGYAWARFLAGWRAGLRA